MSMISTILVPAAIVMTGIVAFAGCGNHSKGGSVKAQKSAYSAKSSESPLRLFLAIDTESKQPYAFKLTVTNTSSSPVVLDDWSLIPVLGAELCDHNGKRVPGLPPFIPDELKHHVQTLEAGKRLDVRFDLRNFVAVSLLDRGHYVLRWIYDTSSSHANGGPWIGKVVSNDVGFNFNGVAE